MEHVYRMYFLTLYQLAPIHKGIQCGHAENEYRLKFGNTTEYAQFSKYDKTWIVLNGGRSQDLLQTISILDKACIPYASFSEPDLYDVTTATCFLVSNRVWDRENYPDFQEFKDKDVSVDFDEYGHLVMPEYQSHVDEMWIDWILKIGDGVYVEGLINATLKHILRGKGLAT